MKLFKENGILIAIILLGALTRLFLLGIIPFGVTHDELGYIFNAYSIALTGKNVFNQTFPFLTWMVAGGFPFMPVPIYLTAPIYWIFKLTPTIARLPYALLGITDIFLLYMLILQLFKNKTLAILSALFLAISPWHIHFSRTSYDANVSAFFFLLGIIFLLRDLKKNKLPLTGLVFFLLGIYSYRGMSIISIPILIAILMYAKAVFKIRYNLLLKFGLGIIVLIVCLVFTSVYYGHSYTSEGINLFNSPKMTEDLAAQARDAQGPLIIKRIFINKPVYIYNHFKENYISTFSPGFLFLHTESSAIYSIWSRGRIYFIDSVFILLGLAYLFKINKPAGALVTSMLFISALPGGIGGGPYSSRDFFMSILFPVFTSAGIISAISWVRQFKYLFIAIISVIFIFSFASYLFSYYAEYSFQQSEAFAKSLKEISLTAYFKHKVYAKVYLGPVSFGDFIQFAFYVRLKPQEVQQAWIESGKNYSGPFRYKNVYFLARCPKIQNEKSIFVITNSQCLFNKQTIALVKDYYGNTIWKEYSY